jgi:hypothetical protein
VQQRLGRLRSSPAWYRHHACDDEAQEFHTNLPRTTALRRGPLAARMRSAGRNGATPGFHAGLIWEIVTLGESAKRCVKLVRAT